MSSTSSLPQQPIGGYQPQYPTTTTTNITPSYHFHGHAPITESVTIQYPSMDKNGGTSGGGDDMSLWTASQIGRNPFTAPTDDNTSSYDSAKQLRLRDPGDHEIVVVTKKELIAAERKMEVMKIVKGELADNETNPEINTILWEQAEWHTKVYAVLEPGSFPSDIPHLVEKVVMIVSALTFIIILLSCASILVLSYPEYELNHPKYWDNIEVFCVVIFTTDVVLRFATCPNKFRFVYDIFNWIDIISILPFYVGTFGGTSFPWYLRIIRSLRIARLVKVLQARNILGLKDFLFNIQQSLAGVVLFFIVTITGMFVFATIMYFAERGEFDDNTKLWWRVCTSWQSCRYANLTLLANTTFIPPLLNSNMSGLEVSPFQSIAGALWFTISTMTTTGTGEVQGTSLGGRISTAIMGFAGVLFIGLPIMIFAGNHDTYRQLQADYVVRNSWKVLHRRKRRLANSVLGTLDMVQRYFGWTNTASDAAWMELQYNDTQPSEAQDNTRAPNNGSIATVVGYYRVQGLLRAIRKSMVDPDEFLFEPLYMLVKDDRGRPKGRVLWASAGTPTLVEYQIILENEKIRAAVATVAKNINPNARIACDSRSGFVVRHSSPLDALRTQSFDRRGHPIVQAVTRWTMLPVQPRSGFRNGTFPIYFKRTDDAHQEDGNLRDEDGLKDALASLLGSGLVVETYIPIPSFRRRLMIVTQFLQQTRLHRVMELLCAQKVAVQPHAYITESDFGRLIQGISRRLELIDPSLAIEDFSAVERAITQLLIGRLRRTKMVHVPRRLHVCVYNSEVLEDDDVLIEVPMSLFLGDEEDVVEQDCVGYVEVTARTAYGRAIRVEFMVSMVQCDVDQDVQTYHTAS